MISPRVLTEADVHAALADRGFIRTDTRTKTGYFWAHAASDQHIQVPDSLDGFYPDWMLYDLMSRIGEIVPSSESHFTSFQSRQSFMRH